MQCCRQVSRNTARQTEVCHRLTLRRELEFSPYPVERVASGDSAGIAFSNRHSQRGKSGFVGLFLALQSPERRTNDLAGVFVAPTLDFGESKAVEFNR